MSNEDLADMIEKHRQSWPRERVARDPRGFVSACKLLLERIDPDSGGNPRWLDAQWAEMLFGDGPSA